MCARLHGCGLLPQIGWKMWKSLIIVIIFITVICILLWLTENIIVLFFNVGYYQNIYYLFQFYVNQSKAGKDNQGILKKLQTNKI
jgi:hypothetical protein